jgi:methylenetetrahydrofolate reductase (NADPH)
VGGELRYATELVELARAIGGFSVGVAAHPAGHPASPDMDSDRDLLAAKLRLADFAITQFFFEADDYLGLVADLAQRGVTKPVLPGIMPVTSLRSVPRMAQMGAAVPEWAVERLEAAAVAGGDEAVRRAGIAMATDLCARLLAEGAPGLHFYTLNRSNATREIHSALGLTGMVGTA